MRPTIRDPAVTLVAAAAGGLIFFGLLMVSMPDEFTASSVLGGAFKAEVSDGLAHITIDPHGLGQEANESTRASESHKGGLDPRRSRSRSRSA
jgi:hypothetical protein